MATAWIALLALTVTLPAWVMFQRWIARRDPAAPGVEGCHGKCGAACEKVCDDRNPPPESSVSH